MKLKQAAKKHGFRDSDDEGGNKIDDLSSMSEESGEFEMDDEAGEDELSEEDEPSSKAKHDKNSKVKGKAGQSKEEAEEIDPARKKAIEEAYKQYEYMHASSLEGDDSDMEEEGELEMEEGEYEWEEGESEMELPEGVEEV